MRLLVIGGGGREHAIIWKLNQSPRVEKIFAVPGNGGIAGLAECRPELPVDNALVDWAAKNDIDLVVIGPEAPLVDGLADLFSAAGIPAFGPSAVAARLEGSKSYAKEIMTAAGVPAAAGETFSDCSAAVEYLSTLAPPYVIKADGLAAGKGVVIAEDRAAAQAALEDCLIARKFGAAGTNVVVEEFLEGQEVSVLAFVDGRDIKAMPPAQDYKRIGEGDTGPNTGGMGAYAPVPFVGEEDRLLVVDQIMRPVIAELARRGVTYQGVLYAGLILTEGGPKVLEFNVRFGDPETQIIMPLLRSDLLEIIEACIDGRLAEVDPVWADKKALTVVLASEGYPESPKTGREIGGLDGDQSPDVTIFHAGTALREDGLVSSGGRVLNITALGGSFALARERAYAAVDRIHIEGMRFRRDIGAGVAR